MLKTGFYEYFTNGDVLLIGLLGLALVLMNWWDLIRYSFQRTASAAPSETADRPSRFVAPAYAARLPRALRAFRRMQNRRRGEPRSIRPGHRPVRHAV